MNMLKDLSRQALWIGLATVAAAALFGFSFNVAAGAGLLLGGVAGTVGFWLMAHRLERLEFARADRIQMAVYRWMAFRMVFYAMALGVGYLLDRTRMYGLVGAAAGILLARMALIVAAIVTQKRGRQSSRT